MRDWTQRVRLMDQVLRERSDYEAVVHDCGASFEAWVGWLEGDPDPPRSKQDYVVAQFKKLSTRKPPMRPLPIVCPPGSQKPVSGSLSEDRRKAQLRKSAMITTQPVLRDALMRGACLQRTNDGPIVLWQLDDGRQVDRQLVERLADEIEPVGDGLMEGCSQTWRAKSAA